jgi:uncharacterized membrane protein YraQ (UPF0718 family)
MKMLMYAWHALSMSFAMFWEILWALALGFGLSAVIQAVISKGEMSKLLPDNRLSTLWRATWLGAASSSCSYAAVAIARSMVQKGADFTAAIAFEFASTNLVVELGIILWLLVGWQFTLAEYVGGGVMVLLLALLFKVFLKQSLVDEAVGQANKGIAGRMEGHAGHDMSVGGDGTIIQRMVSKEGITAISHFFVMDILMMWKEIAAGLLVTGALAAWVPPSAWQHFFLSGRTGFLPTLWGAAVGPIVAVLSFVCSIGNVPLAAVLWNGGISFAGVVSFIFADLLILPILSIYRKYYGLKMAAFLAITSYAAMVAAGLLIEGLFSLLHLIPTTRHALVLDPHITLNYTSVLNVAFLGLSGMLLARYLKTGGPEMMAMMDSPDGGHCSHESHESHEDHSEHQHHGNR